MKWSLTESQWVITLIAVFAWFLRALGPWISKNKCGTQRRRQSTQLRILLPPRIHIRLAVWTNRQRARNSGDLYDI